jgi:hypothetical protein
MHPKKLFLQIKFNCTSIHEIEGVIKSLKSSTSYGCDEISVKIIKESSPFIRSPLAKIGNQSLFSGIFPDYPKYSDIKPIYKNGVKHIMTDYRLIPYNPPPKFLKINITRLLQHSTFNNFLLREQFGFKSKSSSDKAIFILLNKILNALNNKLTMWNILSSGKGI